MSYGLREIARDLIAGRLQLSSEELARERIKVCEVCPSFRAGTRTCALCNCQLDMKTKVLPAECPAEKW